MSSRKVALASLAATFALFHCSSPDQQPPSSAAPANTGGGTAAGAGGATSPTSGAPSSAGAAVAAGSAGMATLPEAGTVPEIPPEPGDPSFTALTASATTVGLYDMLVVTVRSSTAYDNPLDPDDIEVNLVVTEPDGAEVMMPAFHLSGGSGDSTWEARFTPRKLGRSTYRIQMVQAGATLKSDQGELEVTASELDGFLHLTPETFYNLVFDSGKRFRGVGENFGWETDAYKFDDMLPRLRSNKVNFVRTWEGPGRYAMEHGQTLGNFDMAVVGRLDQVMTLARANGIYLMSCLEPAIYYLLTPHGGDTNIQWSANPYSSARGGPAASPADFFTNEDARRHYKNRLRYAIARWGAYPELAVWEFWNEFDHIVEQQGVSTADIADWHQEMADYLAATDPYDRIVTTSISHNDYADLWSLPGMQFSQRHLYGDTAGIISTHTGYEEKYDKPFVAGEFSYDWRWPLTHSPATYGREVHMALWRGMFAPTPILPMTWWWDFHADNDQYFHFEHASTMAAKTAEGPGPLEPQTISASNGLEALALKSPSGRFVWVHNPGGGAISGASFTLSGLDAQSFEVHPFDTWSGAWGAVVSQAVSGGSLTVALPSLGGDADMAYWLEAP
ncbi:MAG TPA: DUF5060 domain-containing protein [Polyangiaceae bacterium]|nr:DUF5060 domain-containing protein [Polyangiaceae bacterium]